MGPLDHWKFPGEKEYIAGNMDFLLGDRDQIPIDPVLSAAFFCVFAVVVPPTSFGCKHVEQLGCIGLLRKVPPDGKKRLVGIAIGKPPTIHHFFSYRFLVDA